MLTEQETAELLRLRDQQDEALRGASKRMEMHTRTLVQLLRLLDNWQQAADKLRAPILFCSSSDLRQAAAMERCALELRETIAEEVSTP